MTSASYTLHHGDCLDVLPTLPMVDAIVTDPPAGIAFMGAAWDGDKGGRDQWVQWLGARLRAARALIRPGGYALVWALPRTSHWTALAIEAAGWRIQDRVSHIFGSGFPKHKSHLKPAVEDWWLAYNPGGTRALNIEACRVGWEPGGMDGQERTSPRISPAPMDWGKGEIIPRDYKPEAAGRYPPHLLLTHSADCEPGACVEGCPVRVLGAQSGVSKATTHQRGDGGGYGGFPGMHPVAVRGQNDTGTAARFFPQFYYSAKASRRERNRGCEGLEEQSDHLFYGGDGFSGRTNVNGEWVNTDNPRIPRANHHPTVKNLALMQWLVRLITPEGGTVLDLFAGSGTTGVAALAEGRSFIGIEKEAAYFAIAQARIADAAAQQRLPLEVAS